MNKPLLAILMILLLKSPESYGQRSHDQQLWLITAKISVNSTYRRDTVSSFKVTGMQSDKEFHQSAQTSASATVSAVVENQAENPLTEFMYTTDGGEPISINVSGKGTRTSSDRSSETINGKLYSADKRNDHVSGAALPNPGIQFSYSKDYKMASISVKINANGNSDAQTYFDEWKDYGGPIENYLIWCDGGCTYPDDKNCKISKTGNSYTASWSSKEIKKANTSNGIEYRTTETNLNITVVPYKESEKPSVTLAGCTNPGIGETSTVTATATPEGGSFKFWAEPGDMIKVTANDATATLTGQTPGKGVLMVEYTAPGGKTAQTSLEASCVKIESYNGGKAIPQIALYDINGKKTNGILTIPVTGQPFNAAELVKFEPSNPAVLSAVNNGNEVTLQGIKTGQTTLQAKTKCGTATGPAVDVEVVNCDDETIDRLEKMKKAAIENLVAAAKDLQSAAGSKEFEKARDELVSSYVELLAKIGLTITTQGKTTGIVTKVEKGKEVISEVIPRAAQVADYGSAFAELVGSSNLEEFAGNVAKPTSGEAFERAVKLKFGEVTEGLYGKSLGAIIGLAEVYQATDKFYNNVGQLVHHEDMIEKFQKNLELRDNELKVIRSRQQFCGKKQAKTNNDDIPLADLKPLPGEKAPKQEPSPKTEPPKVEQPQSKESGTKPPSTKDDVKVETEPPKNPPRQVGLPYEPDDCGCNQSKSLTVSAADFSTISAGIQNLSKCAKDFQTASLSDYKLALQELSTLTESLNKLLATDAAAFLVKAKESKPKLDSLVARIRAYDKAGNTFLKSTEKCPDNISTSMDIFKSVEQVTIDSINTNY